MNGYRVLLFLAFFGVGVALYVAISFGQKLDQELAQINNLTRQNHALSVQITQEQTTLKQSNDQQTAYLQCLLEAQNLGDFPGTCKPPASVPVIPKTISQPISSSPTNGFTPSNAHANPQPIVKSPGFIKRFTNLLHDLTGGVL